MKTRIINLLLVPSLIAGLELIPASRMTAQTAISINFGGANPNAGLISSSNSLYGTAATGGSLGKGTVFAVNTDGTGFTILHNFSGRSDGAAPWDGLILWGNTLYGTAYSGGSSGKGTVFAVNTDGSGFTTLHSFTGGSDGAYPIGGLIVSNNTLYGTTRFGGSSGKGTVFSLSLPPPQLTVTPSGANVILTWPTNAGGYDYTGFILQSATNLASPVVWTSVSPGPVVDNGQQVAVQTISGTHQFYRLTQQTQPK